MRLQSGIPKKQTHTQAHKINTHNFKQNNTHMNLYWPTNNVENIETAYSLQ